jgi:hypothetical protein
VRQLIDGERLIQWIHHLKPTYLHLLLTLARALDHLSALLCLLGILLLLLVLSGVGASSAAR